MFESMLLDALVATNSLTRPEGGLF